MTHPRTLEACLEHALTRSTYVARWTEAAVRAQWRCLPSDSRHRILDRLAKAEDTEHGYRYSGWRDLHAWGLEHLDDPTGGQPAVETPLLASAVRAVLAGQAEGAEHVWEDLAQAWPHMMTATRQVVLTDLAVHDDPHLADYATTDPEATRRVARLLNSTGRTAAAQRLMEHTTA